MKKWLMFLILTLLISCSQEIPTSIVEVIEITATVEPTPTIEPTATRIPLADIDLEPILIQEGDLPSGLTGGQVRDFSPPMFDDLPDTVQEIYRQFERNGETAGGVNVLLYESRDDLIQAYDEILDGMDDDINESGIQVKSTEIENVGERAHGLTMLMEITIGRITRKDEFVDLLFHRCDAVVHIRISGTSNLDEAISYGRRLDMRLQPLVCP